MRRIALLAGAIAASVTAAAPAAADPTLAPRGALTYVWHGDPARGCARVGVCGVTGVLIVRPWGSVDATPAFRRSTSLTLNAVSASVRVRRRDPGSEGTCVDTGANGLINELSASWSAAGALRARLIGGLSAGRCAGPLPADFARIKLGGRHRGGPRPMFDLRESVPFSAGPYSGTLVSTLKLTPMSPRAVSLLSAAAPALPPGLHRRRIEQLELDYRVALASGAISLDFSGAADPLCMPFDVCATRGQLDVVPARRTVAVTLVATRRAPRHSSRAGALRAFAAGRFGMLTPGQSGLVGVQVTETLSRRGATTCLARHGSRVELMLGAAFQSPRRTIPFVLNALNVSGGDPLRTYCSGPESADLLPHGVLARATLTRRALLARRSVATLEIRGAVSGGPFAALRTGAIAAHLTLTRVRVLTFTELGIGG